MSHHSAEPRAMLNEQRWEFDCLKCGRGVTRGKDDFWRHARRIPGRLTPVSLAGVHQPMAVEFQTIDKKNAEALFTAMPKEAKWANVVGALVMGQAVFVPRMSRNQLESVRSIVNYRGYGRLRSRSTEVDSVPGRLLRVQRPGGS